MCRLFGMNAGAHETQATFWLLDAPDSLSAQSHQNADGTGIGYFSPDGAPQVDKQPIAAFEDREFACQARQISSRTFVAHVRHATNGALSLANTHPFRQDGRLFAHNGVIGNVPELEERLGAGMNLVDGQSDSERYFALVSTEIERHSGDVAAGIRAATKWIVATLPVISINFVLITADDLWTLRYPETNTLFVLEREAGGGDPGPDAPLRQTSSLGSRVHCEPARERPLVIVASERLDEDPAWREISSGELLHVGPSLQVESETLFPGPPPHTM